MENYNVTMDKARFYAREGNRNMLSQTTTTVAEQVRDINFQNNAGYGQQFRDQTAVRIAQANEEITKFGHTLANLLLIL